MSSAPFLPKMAKVLCLGVAVKAKKEILFCLPLACADFSTCSEIKSSAASILSFATVGTLISTFLVGTSAYYLLTLFGIEAPYIACLLFGALISPTDLIAVIGILKKAKLSKSIEIKITGECY